MKKFLTFLIFLLFCSLGYGQQYKMYKTENIHNQLRLNTATGAVVQIQDDGQIWTIANDIVPSGNKNGRFRLYKTQNMWTFIELDTFTGRLWQVQFSVKSVDYMFAVPINERYLSYSESPIFTIEPMTSMFQYYLINQESGEMWQFQWTTKSEEGYRWIKQVK